MKNLALILSIFWIATFCLQAEARVFNYKEESFAVYFRGTGALSKMDQEAFKYGSGDQTTFDKGVVHHLSGEFGILYVASPTLNVRLAGEIIQAGSVDAVGSNAAGTKLMDLRSEVHAINPNVTFEFIYAQQAQLRFLAYLGAGMASVTMDNSYTMTADGTSLYGNGDTVEKAQASSISYHGGLGFEVLMADTTTFQMDLGYRHLQVKDLKHKGDGIVIPNTNVSKGQPVLNYEGSKRSFDMSGLYVGASFRFYIKFL